MPRLSLWKPLKGADYRFFDRSISEWFGASGAAIYVHLYIGPYDQSGNPQNPATSDTDIEDVLFLENRDRQYDPSVYELRGIYNVGDADFDLRQFGLFLQNDTVFLEVHLNDMVALLGRKLMSGDVIELPNQRDDFPLNGGPSLNKFYVVQDASKASDGYSATWFPHIWRVKLTPMTGTQEYQDILDQPGRNPLGYAQSETLGEIMTTTATNLGLDEAVIAAAKESVKKRYFETRQFWFCPGKGSAYPWVFAGDGIPPDGATLLGSGRSFPTSAADGDYYLRTDYTPYVLFRLVSGAWRIQEIDYRGSEWSAANALLLTFVNNNRTATYNDGTQAPEKIMLSQAVKPRVDL